MDMLERLLTFVCMTLLIVVIIAVLAQVLAVAQSVMWTFIVIVGIGMSFAYIVGRVLGFW